MIIAVIVASAAMLAVVIRTVLRKMLKEAEILLTEPPWPVTAKPGFLFLNLIVCIEPFMLFLPHVKCAMFPLNRCPSDNLTFYIFYFYCDKA